jgi:type I restriction enzyme, S subunit
MKHYKPYPRYRQSNVPWLGRIPTDWQVRPIKSLASQPGSLFIDGDWIESKDLSPNGIRYITTGNVGEGEYREQGSGFITEATFEKLSCTDVLPGDILISRLNPPIGRSCIVPNLNSRVITSVDNVIFRPSSEFDAGFLVFRFSAADYFYELGSLAGGATMQRVSRSELGNLRVALPPHRDQILIAHGLRGEVEHIDSLMSMKARFIELLKEKRQALIAQAVTRGLNPKAKLKDSGVAWLGNVPAHWDIRRLGTLYREVSRTGERGLPVLSISIHDGITDDELDPEERGRKVYLSEDRSKYKRVQLNDLAYNTMRAWQGAFGAVLVDGLVSPAYVVAEPSVDIRSSYIENLLRTPMAIEEMRRYSKGIADFRMRLYWEYFKDLKVCLPPANEQEVILEFVSRAAKRIDLLGEKTQYSLDLLKERRSALITAAVTGQIDLREVS